MCSLGKKYFFFSCGWKNEIENKNCSTFDLNFIMEGEKMF